ncbi:MAG: hypothetical protein RL427_1573 [Bacteroidota bacterium]|jgi:hypothetical protein
MKNIVLVLLLSFCSYGAFAQDEIKDLKYTEEKAAELSKVLAKVHAINAFGFKNHLIKTFVLNYDLGYTKDQTPTGSKQYVLLSVTDLDKEMKTKLYKVENLINAEVIEINEYSEGYEVKLAHGIAEDRIEQTFDLLLPKK